MATDLINILALASFDSADIETSYQKLNSTPFAYPTQLMVITNDSTEPVIISIDGVTDQIYVAKNTVRNIYAQQTAQPLANKSAFAAQTTVWIRGSTAGSGTIALEAYYNQP